MKVSRVINIVALCGFATASPLPDAVAQRDADSASANVYGKIYLLKDDGVEKRDPQRNTYGKAYTLKMKDDGFEKRDPQRNTYGKAYTLKMKDDGFEKRDPQNTYGRAYTLKMEDDGF